MSREKYLGGCYQLSDRFGLTVGCCGSCHEDEGMGYEMCEVEVDEGYYVVCCALMIAHDNREQP